MNPERLDHLVLFKLSDALRTGSISDLEFDIAGLMGAARVSRWRLDRDLGLRPGNPRAFDVALRAEFADPDEFNRYTGSAAHRRFLDDHVSQRRLTIAAIQVRRQ